MPDLPATLRTIADGRRDDPLRPVTVVAPSHAAALQMRRRLGELTPFAAVRFETFPRLSELLGAGHLAADGRRPLARPIGDYLAGQIAVESQGTLAAVSDLAGYARVLRQLFRRLRRAGITSSSAIHGAYPEHAREIFRLYDRFREASAAFYDEEDLLDAAAVAVEAGRAGALSDIGAIYVAPPGALTAAGTRLLDALRSAAPGFEEIEEGPDQPQSQRFVLAPDPASEARCVVRDVITALEEGVPLHEIGVFHGADASYGRLLREAFADSGVPVAPMPGLPLIETRAGRGVLALASLPERDFSRAAAMEFLSIAPLKEYIPAGDGNERLTTNDWDRLSREAGITRGKDAWDRRLGIFISDKEDQLQSPGVAENEAWGRAITYQRDKAERLRAVMGRLLARLEPLRRDQDAASFIEAFKSIVEDYFDADDDALESVIDEIDQLGTVGAVGGEFSLDNFGGALRANLELAFTRERGLGDGVVIAEYRIAGGLEFRRVILCGAFEGALPAGPGGDAILDDRVWQSLKDEHPFIEDATTRIKRARESAERAIGAAAGGHLTWSAPRHEPGGGRGYYPSPMMAEAYSATVGRRVTASELLLEVSSEDVAHPGSALGSMLAGPVVDAAELGLRDAVRSAQAGATIPEDDPRARPLALLRARRSGVFTEWDGNVAGLDGELLAEAGKKVSPTSLETYGACGYRYFARSVLRLNVVEEPDEREMMGAAERGSVIHRVLERFFLYQHERGRPAAKETWTAADETLLLQIADEELANAAARGQTGLEVYSKHEVRTIGSDLRQFLVADNALRQMTGAVPAEFEQAIPPTEIAGVTLRGRVDRIDRTPDGRTAYVIDYKTGSTYEFRDLISGKSSDPLLGGRKLQLPTYLAAAGDAENAVAMYWFITRKGGFTPLFYARTAANRERFEATLTAIVDGIRGGSFPAVPNEEDEWRGGFENCTYCEFDRICSRRRDIEYSAKESDTAAQAWRGVRLAA
ncbi:MAG: PD-(D/E)XK nuclease family protein, partial [Chloroflexi bacterium]|nr:PD-(D/E)XK nuclease family protein [Chloroflexota bacterium]